MYTQVVGESIGFINFLLTRLDCQHFVSIFGKFLALATLPETRTPSSVHSIGLFLSQIANWTYLKIEHP